MLDTNYKAYQAKLNAFSNSSSSSSNKKRKKNRRRRRIRRRRILSFVRSCVSGRVYVNHHQNISFVVLVVVSLVLYLLVDIKQNK